MNTTGKYNFIKFKNVVIKNFSLYSKDSVTQTVDESINDGV